ncbi:MAG: ABC transporter permease [Polyangiaceae bacterium]|nr:ABC transporter permease [Polyangiaceae bacterium]
MALALTKALRLRALWESARMAFGSVRDNAMRSVLTGLGIVIGVATVISMLGVVAGIDGMIAGELGRLGASSFVVQKYPVMRFGSRNQREYRIRPALTLEDAKAIQASCPSVEIVLPQVAFSGQQAHSGGNKTDPDVQLMGTTSAFPSVWGISAEHGRNFTPLEDVGSSDVALIGLDIVDRVFPYGDPVGQYFRVGSFRLRVVGVLERRGAVFGQSQDNIVVVPLPTLIQRFDLDDRLSLTVKAKPGVPVSRAMSEVRGIMRVRHKLKLVDKDTFELVTQDSLMSMWTNLTGAVFAAAIGIASISLLVGGVGIMNIMLVSVKERTREIGTRKALGARPRDISRQFLIEACVLSFLGGLIGVILGVGGLELTSLLTDALPVKVEVGSVVLALGFSAFVGVSFGYFPARRAATLNPIEALRYE